MYENESNSDLNRTLLREKIRSGSTKIHLLKLSQARNELYIAYAFYNLV